MTTPIQDAVAGRIPPEVAVARLLLAGGTVATIAADLDAATSPPLDAAPLDLATAPLDAMRRLIRNRPAALDALSAEVAATIASHDASGPTPAEGIARIAAFFDRAVRHSPEASVALYSLGDPAILAAATTEIVGWLTAQNLLRPGADVLDLGCGIGRIAAAMAPACRSVLGLDVSHGMVREAATRLRDTPNVTIRHTAGQHLDDLAPATFDLILAIDSFPYIVQTGPETALRHAQGAARALRPGGALCILNLSYRNDPAADRADAAAWAAATGLTLVRNGEAPFRRWDGTAFVLAK